MASTTPQAKKHTVRLGELPRNVWVVTITSFLTDISSEMVINLIPLFLANVLGVRTGIVGLIEGIAETTASLLKVFSGWLSDRLGRRKRLAVAGYALSTAAKPFLYFATTWGWVLAVRSADRMGKGIRTAPRDALVADTVDERHRGLAFGLHRAGDTAGAVIGLLLAMGLIWAVQGRAMSLSRFTFQSVVLFSIIPATLAVIVLAVGAQDVPVAGHARRLPSLSLRGFSAHFKGFLLIVILFTLGNSSYAFLVLRAQERGISVLGIMGMLVTFNVIYSLISGPAGALSDRVGRRRLLVSGWLGYGLIYLGFALAGAAWEVWTLFALYGVYYGMTEGVARAMVADLASPEQRGTAFGVYSAAIGLTALPASLIAGLLWQGVAGWQGLGPRAPFFFGATMALVAVALLALWLPNQSRAQPVPEEWKY